jgi:hypothetical protein
MRRLSVVLLAALAVAGCKKKEPAPEQQQAAAAAAPGALPAEVTGKVQERLDAPPYSYLRLQTKDGEVWAAVQKTDVELGKDVTVIPSVYEESRTSSTLNRTFNKLYLGSLKGAEMAGAPGGMGAMGAPPEGMGAGPQHGLARTDYKGAVKVSKASGSDARTIGEVFGQRTQLKDKPVTIRGTVVKVNANILGKNWVHIQDGTGSGETSDLVVLTNDESSPGDVVTVKGMVRVDQDPGHGSKWPAFVDGGKLSIEKK